MGFQNLSESRGGLNFFLQSNWTASPLFLPDNNPPLISLWLDLSCDYFSVELLPISFSTSWSRKISYQVHLNQSETEKYFERIYDKDIYEKSYTTHVKTHSSLTLSVVLVSAAQFCFQALAIALDLFPFFTHKYLSYKYLHFCHPLTYHYFNISFLTGI